jgi:hypothetical protein
MIDEELFEEIKEMLKYAIRHKDWSGVSEVIERINEELDVVEKVEYIHPRDDDAEEDHEL